MPMDETSIRKSRGGILDFPSFKLAELERLCRILEIPRCTATRLCKSLNIPLMYIGRCAYYNEFAFERAVYVLTRVNGPGFAAPGSRMKTAGKCKLPTEMTKALTAQLQDPGIMVEMVAAQGRNINSAVKVADAIKRFDLKKEVGKTLTNADRTGKTTNE